MSSTQTVTQTASSISSSMSTTPSTTSSTTSTTTTVHETSTSDLCLTPGCINAASQILMNMNKEVPPCEDFYEFTCGNWPVRNVIPEDLSSYGTFTKVRDDLLVQLKSVMEAGMRDDDMYQFSTTTRWAKRLYDACMDEMSIEMSGLDPARRLITELSGWTLGSNRTDDQHHWIDILGLMRDYDDGALFALYVAPDSFNTTRRTIYMDQPSLGLPSREYYFPTRKQITTNCTQDSVDMPPKCDKMDDPSDNRTDEEVYLQDRNVNAMYTYMTELVKLYGVDDQQLANDQLRDLVLFERKLANATVPMSERRNKTKMYNPMRLGEIKEKYPNIDWQRYIDYIFRMHAADGKVPNNDTVVIVRQPEYFEHLNQILVNISTDVKFVKMIKNHFMIYTLRRLVTSMNKEIRDLRLKYVKVLYGVEKEPPRWKKCVGFANGNLGFAVGKLYVDKYFDESSKRTALEMIADLRDVFDTILDEVPWLDDETRRKTREKASSITQHIAYPDMLNHPDQIDYEYIGLNFTTDMTSHADNIIDFFKYSGVWDLERLYKPVNKTKWYAGPAVVNAYYSSLQNTIAFPAGILQPPFFGGDVPKCMNFGGIGAVIGHEITHGFDDEGRQTDKDGNLDQWWSESVIENFVEQAKCIVDQYSEYTLDALGRRWNINGTNTQGENIADNGGLKQAYRAYQLWVEKHGEEGRLPGLEQYSPEQLFFINFANVWCSTSREEAIIAKIRTGVHSPGRFRVIGTLSNSEHFSEAFNCPRGSPMNPGDKCAVW